MSFVQEAADVLKIREIIDRERSSIKILAKIEHKAALRNIEEILKQHTAISRAIGAHRPEQAFEAMRRHISFVLDFFKARR